MNRWHRSPIIEQSLDQAPEERVRAMPGDIVAHGKKLLEAISAQIPPMAMPLADMVATRLGEAFTNDARALALRHSARWQSVVLANISYDLLIASMGFGCSTMALPTPEGPMLARNMDWAPEDLLARASVLIHGSRNGVRQFAHAGWSASLGVVSGLSAKGFGLVINAVGSPEGADLQGYPVLLFLRRVLEQAADFEAALKMLTEQRLAVSGLITLVGTRNEQRVVIERTPKRHALRWGAPEQPLWTTNHYRTLLKDDTDCPRYLRLEALLKDFSPTNAYSTTDLLTVLSDPAVRQSITAQHVIMCPARQHIELFVPADLFGV